MDESNPLIQSDSNTLKPNYSFYIFTISKCLLGLIIISGTWTWIIYTFLSTFNSKTVIDLDKLGKYVLDQKFCTQDPNLEIQYFGLEPYCVIPRCSNNKTAFLVCNGVNVIDIANKANFNLQLSECLDVNFTSLFENKSYTECNSKGKMASVILVFIFFCCLYTLCGLGCMYLKFPQ